jgi:hypothetical protein
MTRQRKLLRLTLWIVTVVLIGIQVTFAAKFLNLFFRQGAGPALSYLRGDRIAVQSVQGNTATLILVHQPHPYATFILAAICFIGGTAVLLWLIRVSSTQSAQG